MALRIGFTAIRQSAVHRKFGVGAVRIALHVYTRDFLERVVEKTKPYPAVPEGSTYIRTYELERSWDVVDQSYGIGISYRIVNNARDPYGRQYAGLVHGPTKQWPPHASHGWRNIQDVIDHMGGRARYKMQTQAIIKNLMGAV